MLDIPFKAQNNLAKNSHFFLVISMDITIKNMAITDFLHGYHHRFGDSHFQKIDGYHHD